MTGHEEMVHRLRQDNPGRNFCLSRYIWSYVHRSVDEEPTTQYQLQVLPGFDGSECQSFKGDDALVCVSRCREAMQTADRAEIGGATVQE